MIKNPILNKWGPVVLWAGVIFALSAMPINQAKEFSWLDFVIKKTAHVVEYAIFFWLLYRAISDQGKKYSKKIVIWALVIAMIYALSDEWHQTFVKGREGTFRDVGFDTIGMLLSWTQINKNL